MCTLATPNLGVALPVCGVSVPLLVGRAGPGLSGSLHLGYRALLTEGVLE